MRRHKLGRRILRRQKTARRKAFGARIAGQDTPFHWFIREGFRGMPEHEFYRKASMLAKREGLAFDSVFYARLADEHKPKLRRDIIALEAARTKSGHRLPDE